MAEMWIMKQNLEIGDWSLELGAWNLELRAWNLELGTWSFGARGYNLVEHGRRAAKL